MEGSQRARGLGELRAARSEVPQCGNQRPGFAARRQDDVEGQMFARVPDERIDAHDRNRPGEEHRARGIHGRPVIGENARGDDTVRDLVEGRAGIDCQGFVTREAQHQLVPCTQLTVVHNQENLRTLLGDPSS